MSSSGYPPFYDDKDPRHDRYVMFRSGARPKTPQSGGNKLRMFQIGPTVHHRSRNGHETWNIPGVRIQEAGAQLQYVRSPRVPAIRSAVNACRTEFVTVLVVGQLARRPEYYEGDQYAAGARRALGRRRLKASVLNALKGVPDRNTEMVRAMSDITGFDWEYVFTVYITETQ